YLVIFSFLQAEDGIRDRNVTGVQTCALPILTILPMFNAIFNLFSFGFLSCALVAILRRNVKVHRRFIYAALVSTTLFLVNYVFFHFISSSTSFGGEGVLKGIYYF